MLFVILHASILIIFAGAFVGRIWGMDGEISLYEKEKKSAFWEERKSKSYFQKWDKNLDGFWDHVEVLLWEKTIQQQTSKYNVWQYDFDKNRRISYKEWMYGIENISQEVRKDIETPLPFSILLEKFITEYHPERPRLFVKVQNSKIEESFEVKPGGVYSIPFTSYQVQIGLYDSQKESVPGSIQVTVLKSKEKQTQTLPLLHNPGQAHFAEKTFWDNVSLIYYKEEESQVKAWKSIVEIIENEQTIKKAEIVVNQPLYHKGFEVFQASYFTDTKQNRTKSGLHVVYDPGIILVYLGFSLLSISLLLQFFVAHILKKEIHE